MVSYDSESIRNFWFSIAVKQLGFSNLGFRFAGCCCLVVVHGVLQVHGWDTICGGLLCDSTKQWTCDLRFSSLEMTLCMVNAIRFRHGVEKEIYGGGNWHCDLEL